jgi:hypothetical protein
MSGQAWIQDPKTTNTMRFHLDPKSWRATAAQDPQSYAPQRGQEALARAAGQVVIISKSNLGQQFENDSIY